IAAEAPPDVEAWEMSDGEKVVWRLIKIPRKYIDLENTGVMPAAKVRGFLRGLVSADVVDILEDDVAKPIVPVEIKRLQDKIAGKTVAKNRRPSRLKARVYRPSISGDGDAAGPAAASAPTPTSKPEPAAPASAPAPVEMKAPAAKKATASEPAEVRSQDAEELAAEVEARFGMMGEQNHYEFLEIQPSAQAEGIKKSYMKLAKMLHPDRVAGALKDDAELAEKADKLFKRLQNAWSTLSNEDQRKRYDVQVDEGLDGDSGGKVRRPEEAKVMFLKAEHLAKAKQWQQAVRHYKTALQLDDSVNQARVGIAWATYFDETQEKGARTGKAREQLAELAKHHKLGDAAYKLALISRLEGNSQAHEEYVTLAARLDPRHQEAQQEKRLLQRRKGEKPSKAKGATAKGKGKGGGLLSKLKR
ncbi:MAG: J domain-containing protein, partial [Planctomycetota bacterium]